MKKLFFIVAIASAALVSCTKNELAPSATEQQEISFAAPVVGVQTKAPVYGAIGTSYHDEEAFRVWSIWSKTTIDAWEGKEYFSNVPATFDSELYGWTLSPKYYWPAEGYLSFVALSPSTVATADYSEDYGFTISTWSQGDSETEITDLMYSTPTFSRSKQNYTIIDTEHNNAKDDDTDATYIYNGVDIQFKHALSYITFKVKTTSKYETTYFKLNSITLSSVYTTGKFVQKDTDPWTEDTDASTASYIAYSNADGLPFDEAEVAATSPNGQELILLPQALKKEQQQLTVKYHISTDGTNWIEQNQTVDLFVEDGIEEWKMGKKYIYTLSIGLQEILLDPGVSEWIYDEDSDEHNGTITF